MGVGGSIPHVPHPLAVFTLSTSYTVSQSSRLCCTLSCPQSEPAGWQTLCWLLSLPSLKFSLPTNCPLSLGIRSQIYMTSKSSIFPQHQLTIAPSEADSKARHGVLSSEPILSSELTACQQVLHSWHSRPVFCTPGVWLYIQSPGSLFFCLFFLMLNCIKETIVLGILALGAPSSSFLL